jgi:ferredoxin
MLKVSIFIDCDVCLRLFRFSRFASDDEIGLRIHGETLLEMAADDGWNTSDCGNFHYCPTCSDRIEDEGVALELPF